MPPELPIAHPGDLHTPRGGPAALEGNPLDAALSCGHSVAWALHMCSWINAWANGGVHATLPNNPRPYFDPARCAALPTKLAMAN